VLRRALVCPSLWELHPAADQNVSATANVQTTWLVSTKNAKTRVLERADKTPNVASSVTRLTVSAYLATKEIRLFNVWRKW
jgi:hypothetical protein